MASRNTRQSDLTGVNEAAVSERAAGLTGVDLKSIEAELASFTVPELPTVATTALIAGLRPAVRANRQAAFGEALRAITAPGDGDAASAAVPWFRLAAAQVSLLRPSFWLASLIVTALGVVVQFALAAPAFVLFAPALAALGVAYAFRPSLTGTWEMESACPVRPFEWLMARFGVVVAYDLILLCLATPALARLQGGTVVWRLALLWLGPLLLLTGIALQASLRRGALAGTMLPLACWGVLLAAVTAVSPGLTIVRPTLPALTDTGPELLWGMALVLGIVLIAGAPRIAGGAGGLTNDT